VQKLLVNQWKRDGNILLRKITGSSAQNKFKFALELLEIDLLDTEMNEQLKGGNAVLLGVEFNNWKQPVAYYFRSNKAADEIDRNFYGYSRQNVKRVPADEIIHHFTRDHSNQLIGVTALAQSMLTFHDLQGYDQAAIINARAGASKMGFIQTQANHMPAQYTGDSEDANGNIISNFGFGEIEQLPAGLEFKGWDPTYPSGEYPTFVKQILRRMATGLGVAYANWVGDLEAVNFSSMRSGLLDERDNWKDDQSSFREGVLIPIFNEWLKWAIVSKSVSVNYSELERVNKPEFICRRWDWVDPRADIEAKVAAINNNIITLSDVMAEQGYDFNDYIRRRKKELEQLKEIKELEKSMYAKEVPDKEAKQSDDKEDPKEEDKKLRLLNG
jgi:lambda family phage portal protein